MAQEMLQQLPSEAALPRDKMPTDHRPIWGSLKKWFAKDDAAASSPSTDDETQRPGVVRRLSRKVVPGLPRPGTFKRQQSELRDNLEPVKSKAEERRTVSVDRKGYAQGGELSRHIAPAIPRTSAPVLMETAECVQYHPDTKQDLMDPQMADVDNLDQTVNNPPPESVSFADGNSISADGIDDELLEELEKRWILNLSMHFRDRSNREKFFVTFAESPSHWRRVTVSLDYRDAPLGSLEEELEQTRFQRDKSARIYESIRDSLPDIQFYDTVTNLKLQTENDRLHVHVTEDIHEVISYPPVAAISHLHCRRVREEDLVFDSHLSGFVYKVRVNNEVFIKKEIPGPDTVEEFLYEINALHRLAGSESVIKFGGVIVDNDERVLKGLLISYAEKGALIDVIYDNKGELPWQRRERWARQIVQGLSEIHEAGFVQGDFTLSNIVIDADDKAKIIDINRRGCPVGWEPPEVAALIESRQRISMYIGVKSDIFQLGMVLWAIAMEQDEPETQARPLTLSDGPVEIPSYYRSLVDTCLSDDPRNRSHATVLLGMFPEFNEGTQPLYERQATPDNEEAEYIDPETAVGRDDIDNFRVLSTHSSEANGNARSSATHTYVNAPTDISSEPYYYPTRGRSPSPRSLDELDELNLQHNYHGHVNGIQASEEQSSDYFQPHVISVSPSRHQGEFQNFGHGSAVRLESVHDVDVLSPAEHNHDHINLSEAHEVPFNDHLESQDSVVVSPPLADPPENRAVEADFMPHSTISSELGNLPLTQVADGAKSDVNLLEEQPKSEVGSLLVSTPPPGLQDNLSLNNDHMQYTQFDSIVGTKEKPRDTGVAPESVLEDLAGIGEHSTFEHSKFPQGLLDDDLTNEMQEASCIL